MNPTFFILASIGAVALLAASRPHKASNSNRPRKRRRRRGRITLSTLDKAKTVRESPQQLLAQAREYLSEDIALDELTAARLIASEHGSGSLQEMAAIVDAELNRAKAKGRTLTESLTSAGTYGKQGGRHGRGKRRGKRRPASTRRDPTRKHLQVARAVMSGELRGISLGAYRFFDPVSQWSSHRKWLTGKTEHRHCHPAVILERWTHSLKWNKRGPPCALQSKPGRRLQEWVGPIEGINPMRLMLFRPAKAGDEHKRRYLEARSLIIKRYPLPPTKET